MLLQQFKKKQLSCSVTEKVSVRISVRCKITAFKFAVYSIIRTFISGRGLSYVFSANFFNSPFYVIRLFIAAVVFHVDNSLLLRLL